MANAAATIPESANAHDSAWNRLLSPVDPTVFFNDYFGEKPLYIPGEPDRFADLCSWSDLNDVLDLNTLSAPQLHLMRGGKDLDPQLFQSRCEGHNRVDAAAVLKEMAEGATLIINYVDRHIPRLREFARSLERELRASVHVDIFAGCSPAAGLGAHWDHYECLNVQLSGSKLWKIFRPERLYPMRKTFVFPRRDDAETLSAPNRAPVWEGSLRTGDLIYIPRGWWHQVVPEQLPSLHLGITVEVPAGSDLLHWLADRLKAEEFVRKNIPYWKPPTERKSFLRDLRENVASHINDELLAEYLNHLDETSVPRPALGLPDSANAAGPILDSKTRVRLRSARKFTVEVDSPRGFFRFRWKGKSVEFSSLLLPAFQKLNEGAPQTVQQLSDGVPALAVKALVLALWTAGLVSIGEDGTL
jgi:ribosomal protein L16 Arg81 hydroxylase